MALTKEQTLNNDLFTYLIKIPLASGGNSTWLFKFPDESIVYSIAGSYTQGLDVLAYVTAYLTDSVSDEGTLSPGQYLQRNSLHPATPTLQVSEDPVYTPVASEEFAAAWVGSSGEGKNFPTGYGGSDTLSATNPTILTTDRQYLVMRAEDAETNAGNLIMTITFQETLKAQL